MSRWSPIACRFKEVTDGAPCMSPAMNAQTPQPKSGILDITPYKPGKATAEGVAHPVKLSGNENILGCSPKARDAYLAAVGELNLYPDGRGGPLRASIAERYRIEPECIVLGCGTARSCT